MSPGRMEEAEAQREDEIGQIPAQMDELNAQAATSKDGIVVATERVNTPNDAPELLPMRDAVRANTGQRPEMALAGFRRFALRGVSKGSGEWNLVCATFHLEPITRIQKAAV